MFMAIETGLVDVRYLALSVASLGPRMAEGACG